jgi:Tfp pilus assembly protein PilF
LRAVGLQYFFPLAHFNLGMALQGLGDLHNAIRSFDIAVTQAPGFLDAHNEMAKIYEQLDDLPLWMKHQRMARRDR